MLLQAWKCTSARHRGPGLQLIFSNCALQDLANIQKRNALICFTHHSSHLSVTNTQFQKLNLELSFVTHASLLNFFEALYTIFEHGSVIKKSFKL